MRVGFGVVHWPMTDTAGTERNCIHSAFDTSELPSCTKSCIDLTGVCLLESSQAEVIGCAGAFTTVRHDPGPPRRHLLIMIRVAYRLRHATKVQSLAHQAGELDWVASIDSIDSTIVRVHQHGATLPRVTGAMSNYKKFGQEPPDHAIGRSRDGTTKSHLVCDGNGRALAFVLTPGQAADTIMVPATLAQIRVTGAAARPRSRPDRVIADKQYPSRVNRA